MHQNASLIRITIMRDNQNRPLEYKALPVPRGLFSRIIKRLGLEKDMELIKTHLGFFTALFGAFLVLSVFAVIGLRQVLAESNFGPFISLVFSDPGMVLKYWQSFSLSIFESAPGFYITTVLTLSALILLFIKLTAEYLGRLSLTLRAVKKQKNGYN